MLRPSIYIPARSIPRDVLNAALRALDDVSTRTLLIAASIFTGAAWSAAFALAGIPGTIALIPIISGLACVVLALVSGV